MYIRVKTIFLTMCLVLLTFNIFAATPAPILRNQFSTNTFPSSVTQESITQIASGTNIVRIIAGSVIYPSNLFTYFDISPVSTNLTLDASFPVGSFRYLIVSNSAKAFNITGATMPNGTNMPTDTVTIVTLLKYGSFSWAWIGGMTNTFPDLFEAKFTNTMNNAVTKFQRPEDGGYSATFWQSTNLNLLTVTNLSIINDFSVANFIATTLNATTLNATNLVLAGDMKGGGFAATNFSSFGSSSTNTLAVATVGVTNTTLFNYQLSITAGTSMSMKDSSGTEIFVPAINGCYILKPGFRFTGTSVTAIALRW